MKRPERKWQDALRAWAAISLIGCLPAPSQTVQQPIQLPTAPNARGDNRVPLGTDDSTVDPNLRHAEEQAARNRNNDRHKHLIDDTNRLLELAQELKAEAGKGNNDQRSIAMARKAEEIEKLAKSVKDKMKGP